MEEKKVDDQNIGDETEVKQDAENNSNSEEEELKKKQNSEDNAENENVLEDLFSELREESKKTAEENTLIKSENDILKDRLARTVAEYDNFRKRTAKEKEGIYTDACEDILKQMLPVLDNLERAASVEGSIEDLKKGIEMTIRQFNTALEKLDIEEILIEGEFNPHLHNAVMHVDDEQFGKNQVVEVFQKGYKRGEKVLRHSMVKVAN
jgi:molecular chaperone GrpE